jgi:hypothetical protein
MYRELSDESRATRVRSNLALALLMAGDVDEGKAFMRETLIVDARMENKLGIAWCFAGAAIVAAVNGDAESAARLFGAADAVREDVGQLMRPIVRQIYAPFVAHARNRIGDAAYDEALAAGRKTPLNTAVAEAFKVLTHQEQGFHAGPETLERHNQRPDQQPQGGNRRCVSRSMAPNSGSTSRGPDSSRM